MANPFLINLQLCTLTFPGTSAAQSASHHILDDHHKM
jgi:hypothetical protein